MRSLLFGTLFLVLFSQLCPAQNPPVDNSMSKVVVLSLGGGITLNRTDYKYQKYDYIGKGSLDYFFPSSGRGNFGLGIYGGIGKVDGKDARFIPVEFNTDIDYVGIEATYILSLSKVVYPYVSVGFSSLWFHPKDNAGNALFVSPNNNQQGAFNGEIGFRFMASNSLSLNVAGGMILDTKDLLDGHKAGPKNDAAVTVTAGLSFYFGRNKDTDGDGVPDYLDKCPNTPKGAKVDKDGCPIVVKKEVPKKLTLRGDANFATGKADLLPSAYQVLDDLISVMKDNPKQKWLIEGYTDNVGKNSSNVKLSGRRAQSVVDYFVNKGISRSLFKTKAMGDANPVASNKTKEGRAENRRVEINAVN